MGINNDNNNTNNRNNGNNNIKDIRQFIENENSKYQVVIWSKSYCPYCANTKQLFNNESNNKLKQPKSIKVYELDEMGHEGIEIQKELYNITKQTTVPNIFINTKHIGGNDNLQQLYYNGQLQKQLL